MHRVGRTGRAGNKGFAVTFITPDECASANDLIRALESSSNSAVPDELRELDKLYQQKLEDGEIERRRRNVGYDGKGFKYTKEEDDLVKQERKDLAKSFGYSVEEENVEENDEELAKNLQKKEEEHLKQAQY